MTDNRAVILADVIIVGAGLVGSALACALTAESNLRVVVLDNQLDVPIYTDSFDPRVVALSPAAVGFLAELQVWRAMQAERHCPYKGMEVWDGEGNGRIGFSADELHRETLGFIVENSVAVRTLRAAMSRRVTFLAPCTVQRWISQGDSNLLELSDGTQVQAPLLVGADGAHSQLRDLAEIPVRQWDYEQQAIITTVRTEKPHGYIARQRFSHRGPLALLPLHYDAVSGDAVNTADAVDPRRADKDRFCSIVWSVNADLARELMATSSASFCARMTEVYERCLGEVEWSDQRFCVPLWQRHVLDYGRAGFALVGDAAHTIHPLAGQGVNLGLYDAETLAAEILRAHQRRVPLHHASIIQRYQRQRKLHNLTAMATMEGFKRLFGNDSPWVLTMRNRGLSWVDQQLWLKRLLMQGAAGEL